MMTPPLAMDILANTGALTPVRTAQTPSPALSSALSSLALSAWNPALNMALPLPSMSGNTRSQQSQSLVRPSSHESQHPLAAQTLAALLAAMPHFTQRQMSAPNDSDPKPVPSQLFATIDRKRSYSAVTAPAHPALSVAGSSVGNGSGEDSNDDDIDGSVSSDDDRPHAHANILGDLGVNGLVTTAVALPSSAEADTTSDATGTTSAVTLNESNILSMLDPQLLHLLSLYSNKILRPFDSQNVWTCFLSHLRTRGADGEEIPVCEKQYQKSSRRSFKKHLWKCLITHFPILASLSYPQFRRMCQCEPTLMAGFHAVTLFPRPQRPRRTTEELAENEVWRCPLDCGQTYRNTSSTSIARHLLRECRFKNKSEAEREIERQKDRERQAQLLKHLEEQRKKEPVTIASDPVVKASEFESPLKRSRLGTSPTADSSEVRVAKPSPLPLDAPLVIQAAALQTPRNEQSAANLSGSDSGNVSDYPVFSSTHSSSEMMKSLPFAPIPTLPTLSYTSNNSATSATGTSFANSAASAAVDAELAHLDAQLQETMRAREQIDRLLLAITAQSTPQVLPQSDTASQTLRASTSTSEPLNMWNHVLATNTDGPRRSSTSGGTSGNSFTTITSNAFSTMFSPAASAATPIHSVHSPAGSNSLPPLLSMPAPSLQASTAAATSLSFEAALDIIKAQMYELVYTWLASPSFELRSLSSNLYEIVSDLPPRLQDQLVNEVALHATNYYHSQHGGSNSSSGCSPSNESYGNDSGNGLSPVKRSGSALSSLPSTSPLSFVSSLPSSVFSTLHQLNYGTSGGNNQLMPSVSTNSGHGSHSKTGSCGSHDSPSQSVLSLSMASPVLGYRSTQHSVFVSPDVEPAHLSDRHAATQSQSQPSSFQFHSSSLLADSHNQYHDGYYSSGLSPAHQLMNAVLRQQQQIHQTAVNQNGSSNLIRAINHGNFGHHHRSSSRAGSGTSSTMFGHLFSAADVLKHQDYEEKEPSGQAQGLMPGIPSINRIH